MARELATAADATHPTSLVAVLNLKNIFMWGKIDIEMEHKLTLQANFKEKNLLFFYFDISVLMRYLNQVHDVQFPPDQYWHCTLAMTVVKTTLLCSTSLTIAMTFERFYGIIKPHKAASFNTVKKVKKIILCVALFSIVYNVPHLFITSVKGKSCIPFGNGKQVFYGLFYYWLSLIVNYIIPFILLIKLNSVIIHTLRNRPMVGVTCQGQSQGQNEGQRPKVKSSEKHIYVILLLVTFGFLILSTPSYVFCLLQMVYNYNRTPSSSAAYHLFMQIAGNMNYTNSGINFFLYVLSGRKFRSDLVKLFNSCGTNRPNLSKSTSSLIHTTGSVLSIRS